MSAEHPSYDLLKNLAAKEDKVPADDHVREHVAGCRDCQTWTDTYRLLAQALPSEGHPPSEHLARYAVHPERLSSTEREGLADHLSSCSECLEHLELTGQALANSRGEVLRFRTSPRTFPMATRLALAASLILLLGLAWMFRPTVGTSEIVVSEQLSHERLSGIHVIEATGSITAAAVTVETGGDVTFRAGDVVVLSDGFAVGDGASFQIEIAPPAGENNG